MLRISSFLSATVITSHSSDRYWSTDGGSRWRSDPILTNVTSFGRPGSKRNFLMTWCLSKSYQSRPELAARFPSRLTCLWCRPQTINSILKRRTFTRGWTKTITWQTRNVYFTPWRNIMSNRDFAFLRIKFFQLRFMSKMGLKTQNIISSNNALKSFRILFG